MDILRPYAPVAAVALFLMAAERLWPARKTRGELGANAVAFILTAISMRAIAGALSAMETAFINAHGGGLIDLRALPWPVGAAVYLVAMDFGEYIFHRAQHQLPWMWAMHSLHHSDRELGVTTTERHFWLEPAIKAVSIWLVVALLFKVNAAILAVYFVAGFYHLFVHANLKVGFGPLSWLLNSPQYHRLHHSREPAHHNANFSALLPLFDVLSGAYRRPGPGEFPLSGLDDETASPLDLLVWPLRTWLRPARAAPAPPTA